MDRNGDVYLNNIEISPEEAREAALVVCDRLGDKHKIKEVLEILGILDMLRD